MNVLQVHVAVCLRFAGVVWFSLLLKKVEISVPAARAAYSCISAGWSCSAPLQTEFVCVACVRVFALRHEFSTCGSGANRSFQVW